MIPLKYFLSLFLAVVSLNSNSALAALLTDTTFGTNTNFTDNNGFVQSGTVTWTINPGVTVTAATGRFFIGEQTAPNTIDALFVVTGGGTLLVSNANAFTMRLGQNQTNEGGVLRIEGGALVNFTGNQGPFSQESDGILDGVPDSRIILAGLGSTLMAEGTYNTLTGLYNRGVTTSEALPVLVEGGTLSSSYDAINNVTTLTVIPEPSSLAALGIMLGGICWSALRFRSR